MKTLIERFFVTLLIVVLFSPAFGQSKEQNEVISFVKSFANAYDNFDKTKDLASVLDFVSKDLYSTIVRSNVGGRLALTESKYPDFERYLTTLKNTQNLEISWKISSVYDSFVKGSNAFVVTKVNSEVKGGQITWSKSVETVTFTLVKGKTGWKIIHFSTVNFEQEQVKGDCYYDLYFSNSNTEVVARLIVPNGEKYDTNMENFEVKRGKEISVISVSDRNYNWKENGEIYNKDNTMIGNADDEREAVLIILGKDMYKESCVELVKRVK